MKTHPGLWILFALLCFIGGVIMLFPGYRFSAWLTFGIAALVLIFQLLRLLQLHAPTVSILLRRILGTGICLGLLLAAVTGYFIIRAGNSKGNAPCDYLIVLGAGVNGTVPSMTLRDRLEGAYAYLQEHPDTVCIVSGGQGQGEDITEAECMATWLTGKGIDPGRILREEKAASTWENLANSLVLIDYHHRSPAPTVGIVSSEYHLYRTSLMARSQGFDPVLIPAHTHRVSLRVNYCLREIAGVWHYWVFGP